MSSEGGSTTSEDASKYFGDSIGLVIIGSLHLSSGIGELSSGTEGESLVILLLEELLDFDFFF